MARQSGNTSAPALGALYITGRYVKYTFLRLAVEKSMAKVQVALEQISGCSLATLDSLHTTVQHPIFMAR